MKKISAALKKLFHYFARMIDAFFAVFLLLIVFLGYKLKFVTKKKSRNNHEIAILRLGISDLESIYKKFGDFNQYFLHTIPNVTKLVVGSCVSRKNNLFIRLRDDYVIMETILLRKARLMSLAYYFIRHFKVIHKYNITIIHANDPYFAGLLGLLLARIAGLPFCVSIHTDYDHSERLHPGSLPKLLNSIDFTRAVERFVYHRASLILPIREHLKIDIIKKGIQEDKIEVFHHGLDLQKFNESMDDTIIKKYDIPKNAKLVFFAGRADKVNYIHEIIDIALKTVEMFSDAYFIIAGNGNELNAIKLIASGSKYSNRILLPGMIHNSHVCELRKFATVNICLAGGFSLIEACAAGTPVIAYDVAWHYELIQNNETGILVEEHDVEAVLNGITFIFSNPQEASRMALNARQLAFERHNLEQSNATKAAIYRRLLRMI